MPKIRLNLIFNEFVFSDKMSSISDIFSRFFASFSLEIPEIVLFRLSAVNDFGFRFGSVFEN